VTGRLHHLPEPRVDDAFHVGGQAVGDGPDAHPNQQRPQGRRELAGDGVTGGIGFGLEAGDELVQIVALPELAATDELLDLVDKFGSHAASIMHRCIPQDPGDPPVASFFMAPIRMADRVGRVLGGRYRLRAAVGAGASAQVFLADDASLGRQVAVKLLHPALAGDDAFLRRFQAEARASAALSHPNIMAVYDWGEDDDAPYLVCEYLSGGSLRALLDAGARLSPSQALLVGLEAARGLEYAHRRSLVHRDVKPGNLLFDGEGHLRIADFGLARALAEAAWTEPAGALLGTARYAAPEQVRGQSVDGRADVYALAVVLVEAVTGEVPFAADTTIATLMARVEKPLTGPPALGPLGPVVEEAGRPDPAERPDAGAFAAALETAARQLPKPAALPLAGNDVSGDLFGDEPTELGVT